MSGREPDEADVEHVAKVIADGWHNPIVRWNAEAGLPDHRRPPWESEAKIWLPIARAALAAIGSGTPAARWRTKGEPDPHGDRYDRERATLCYGNLTDDEVANAVFFEPTIGYLTAAKERIRWLSRQLEALRQGRDAVIEECARIAESSPEDHIFCDHNDGYMDGRLDAAAAIRARRRGDDDDLSTRNAGCRSAVVAIRALDSPEKVIAPELAEVDEAIEKLRRSVESTPQIVTCPKCGLRGVAFNCDEPGCPVNGGAAYGPPTPPATSDLRERATAVTPLYMRAVALIKKIELMERSEDEALVIEAEFAAIRAEAKAEGCGMSPSLKLALEQMATLVEKGALTIDQIPKWLRSLAEGPKPLAANRPSPIK